MLRFLLLTFCTLAVSCGFATADQKTEPYLLSPGDVVLVSVWREESLQLEVRVLPDGSITFPLAGRVEVAGLDTTTAAQNISAQLEEYLPDPSVSVVVTGIEGNLVYVLGKVTKPGPMVMTGPTSVLQALSVSGGLDKFADTDAIKVVRRNGKAQEILPIHYSHLISGRDMATNIQLQAGDTLVVP
ncbi:polysaccharide biosynthesis/export family protein [Pseudomonas sp.]|uniref:polysaccharide biosynthesis/export family protein n=1 Tax=Pseudomonas sp. TaxID=306 RepID=UPI00299EC0D3|nr:polysaccharide biosynthesis/export family protein [Pseudomonas sp.]MDX1365997.1 polysaccharide biosynthesis/export family protein [Pseudomonas sp.]